MEVATVLCNHSTPKLPLELLLEEVLSHIDPEIDLATLKALSTTCRALLSPCQRQLFAKIAPPVYTTNAPRRRDLLLRQLLMESSPHLATYVREVRFKFLYANLSPVVFTDILPILHNVEILFVFCNGTGNWLRSTAEWQAALFHIIRCPSLKELHLSYITDFPIPELSPSCFNVLKLRGIIIALKGRPVPPLPLSSLRILDVTPWRQPLGSNFRSLLAIAPNLEHLLYHASHASNMLGIADAILCNPQTISNLRTLEVDITWDEGGFALSRLVDEIRRLSSHRGGEMALKNIVISLQAMNGCETMVEQGLNTLDEILFRRSFPHLERLHLVYTEERVMKNEEYGRLERWIKNAFPRLGKLSNFELGVTINSNESVFW